MAANTNNLDHFRMGEPAAGLQGRVDGMSLDYFRMGEPLPWLVRITDTTIAFAALPKFGPF